VIVLANLIASKHIKFYKINKIVPAIINAAPIATLSVSTSLRITTERIIVSATLNLSTGATCDTLPYRRYVYEFVAIFNRITNHIKTKMMIEKKTKNGIKCMAFFIVR
jgi:hypothetical protein